MGHPAVFLFSCDDWPATDYTYDSDISVRTETYTEELFGDRSLLVERYQRRITFAFAVGHRSHLRDALNSGQWSSGWRRVVVWLFKGVYPSSRPDSRSSYRVPHILSWTLAYRTNSGPSLFQQFPIRMTVHFAFGLSLHVPFRSTLCVATMVKPNILSNSWVSLVQCCAGQNVSLVWGF